MPIKLRFFRSYYLIDFLVNSLTKGFFQNNFVTSKGHYSPPFIFYSRFKKVRMLIRLSVNQIPPARHSTYSTLGIFSSKSNSLTYNNSLVKGT